VLRLRAAVEQILSRHTGHPVEKLRLDTDRDRIFDAREALAYGLIDDVVGSLKVARGGQAARRTA